MRGKIALVTGATGGIGRAVCLAYAREGVKVYGFGRNENKIKQLQEELSPIESGSKILQCDVTDYVQVKRALEDIKRIEQEKGGVVSGGKKFQLAYLVNCAGINRDRLLLRTKDSEIMEQFATNTFGVINMCKQAIKYMMMPVNAASSGGDGGVGGGRNGSGVEGGSRCIINISSIVGLYGNAGQSIYAATKSSLIGFSNSMAREFASKNIRVNVICPGYIDTEMIKSENIEIEKVKQNTLLGRIGDPKDVALGVMYLSKAEYVTGSVLKIDGGLRY